jgi:hypothetical protein
MATIVVASTYWLGGEAGAMQPGESHPWNWPLGDNIYEAISISAHPADFREGPRSIIVEDVQIEGQVVLADGRFGRRVNFSVRNVGSNSIVAYKMVASFIS